MANLRPKFYQKRLNLGFIRLLKLEPLPEGSEFTAPLICTTSEHELSESPRYVALSYEWGPDLGSKTITLDGRQQWIRNNLHSFLRRLRSREPLIVWADAICIEQCDDVERTQQVAIMGEIYRSAQSMFAWLGDAANRSDEVIDTLAALNEEGIVHNLDKRNEMINIFYCKDLAKPLYELCIRSYWQRAWIVQEVALPKSVVFYCGDRRLSCSVLEEVCSGWLIQTSIKHEWRQWSETPYFDLRDTVSGAMVFPETETALLRLEASAQIPGIDDARRVERPYQTFGGTNAGPHMTFSRFADGDGWHVEMLPLLSMEYAGRFGIYRADPEHQYGLLLDKSEGWMSFVDKELLSLPKKFDPKVAFSTIMTFWTFLVQTHAGKVLGARRNSEFKTLDQVISMYESWKCSDARDHIFAMLSLAKDYQAAVKSPEEHQLTLRPDYTCTAPWLLLEAVHFCMPEDPITFGRTLTSALAIGLEGLQRKNLENTLVDHVIKLSKGEVAVGTRLCIKIRLRKAKFLLSDLKPRPLKTSADDQVKVFALSSSAWSGPNREIISEILQDIDEPYIATRDPPYYLVPDKLCTLTMEPAQNDVVFQFEPGELFIVARLCEDDGTYQCIGFGGVPEAYSSVRWSPILREHVLHLTWWLSKGPVTISPCRECPDGHIACIPVPLFYLLLDTGTQAGEQMRFTSSLGWPHPDAQLRRGLWKNTLHGPREGFEIYGENQMDQWWAGEIAELENRTISGWPGTDFKSSYF